MYKLALIQSLAVVFVVSCRLAAPSVTADIVLQNGTVYDGTGAKPFTADVAITGDRITFVGDASAAGIAGIETYDVKGLMVTPGFIDMHSHPELSLDDAKEGLAFLYQGITTVATGVDGDGTPDITKMFNGFVDKGTGLNAFAYVGHNAIRKSVMGTANRAPSAEEMDKMKALVLQGMEEGAFGLSTGLFYEPGYYSTTEEVIELAEIAAPFEAIYDTNDRDLGGKHKGIGSLKSIQEAIKIGEESGTRVIFSHLNFPDTYHHGRAAERIGLIDAARARGVEVAAAQHIYTVSQSGLRPYAIPSWASAGGHKAMVARFADPEVVKKLDVQTPEMLERHGGAAKLLFSDPRPQLNGRTLAEVSAGWKLPLPETVRKILRGGNATVTDLDLYNIKDIRIFAKQSWMMTSTGGTPPSPETQVSHPRVYGAFVRKIRQLVIEEAIISMPFAIRSMTGLAADFLKITDRGYIRPCVYADIAVFDRCSICDLATYKDPHKYSKGAVHVIVNGVFALKNGRHTGALAGVPLMRGGEVFAKRARDSAQSEAHASGSQ